MTILIEFVIVIISINSRVVFYFYFLFYFDVVALTSSMIIYKLYMKIYDY